MIIKKRCSSGALANANAGRGRLLAPNLCPTSINAMRLSPSTTIQRQSTCTVGSYSDADKWKIIATEGVGGRCDIDGYLHYSVD